MATNSPNDTDDSTTVPPRPMRDRLHRFAGSARDVLLYSSAYLAFIAVAEVLIVTELLSLPLTPAPAIAGLLTFAVYGNDRVADVETDEQTTPARTAFIRRYDRRLYTLSALAYGLAVALSVLGGPAAFALALVPGAIWVVYALDWLPFSGHVNRLKQIFILNSVLVAGAWALVVVLLPIAFAGAPVTLTAGVVCLTFFLATFVDVEIPNVRDRAATEKRVSKPSPSSSVSVAPGTRSTV
ncbi:UbiA family prenyltransferase [Halomicroarcula sp. GCM10025894]|uniref:UbiA family prenyltransferase n=1 Tax=Halomicroarcula sp. GCM10025894 TaxID=3252673 RepID=UPI0036200DC8